MEMSFKERIVHTILYELGCIILGFIFVQLWGDYNKGSSLILTVSMSLAAAFWGFIYNWLFDKVATGPRLARSPVTRTIHAIGMEGGLMILTTPMIAYTLEMGVVEAFGADILLTLLVLIFTYVYNWIYDYLRIPVKIKLGYYYKDGM